MVWGLFPVDPLSGEDKYYIFCRGTYKVGRKGCDVIINKDKGVSRIHAEIFVDEMVSLNPLQRDSSDITSKVRIRDCSKYGTFINKNSGLKEKLHEFPNKETTLKDGDLVSFGTGACLTSNFCQECTHVLVRNQMPIKEDLLDAIVAKKPIVIDSWLESLAEKSIRTEFPSCNSSVTTLTAEGVSLELANSETRKNCLEGYTFLLESTCKYKHGYQLQLLLEVSGAKTLSIEKFCSSSQDLEYGEHSRLVCVIPRRSKDDSNCFNKLSSLPRLDEMDLICAVLSGHLDPSGLISPSVLISSSCSTDETVVADSDVEAEASSLVHATSAILTEEAPKYQRKEEISINHANNSMTESRVKADDADVEVLTEEVPKYPRKEEISINHAHNGMTGSREKTYESECEHSDIIYSQDLVVRDLNLGASIISTVNVGVLNFKCFKKKNTQSGNSFSSLIPFSKYPYKDVDYGTEEMVESVKEEKKRKQMEAIADDLFNNEKRRRRGVAGSLHGLLTHG